MVGMQGPVRWKGEGKKDSLAFEVGRTKGIQEFEYWEIGS
jgi:hypothetical protein